MGTVFIPSDAAISSFMSSQGLTMKDLNKNAVSDVSAIHLLHLLRSWRLTSGLASRCYLHTFMSPASVPVSSSVLDSCVPCARQYGNCSLKSPSL